MTDADRNSIVRTVQDRHAAVGRDDRAALDEVLCADFHAFESCQCMGGAELLDLMTTPPIGLDRLPITGPVDATAGRAGAPTQAAPDPLPGATLGSGA